RVAMGGGGVGGVWWVGGVVLVGRTAVGLQMRAAALDFRTARLLGVRANRVIGSAVVLSGLLAAIVAVLMTVQTPLVTPDFALRDTILVLAGVVLGGMNRLVSATLGGFPIGFPPGARRGGRPATARHEPRAPAARSRAPPRLSAALRWVAPTHK